MRARSPALGRRAPAQDAGRFLGERMPYAEFARLPADSLELPGTALIVAFAPGPLGLPRTEVLD